MLRRPGGGRPGHPGHAAGAADGAGRPAVLASGAGRGRDRRGRAVPGSAQRTGRRVVRRDPRTTAAGTSARSPGGPGARIGSPAQELPGITVDDRRHPGAGAAARPGQRAGPADQPAAGRRHRCADRTNRPGRPMPDSAVLHVWLAADARDDARQGDGPGRACRDDRCCVAGRRRSADVLGEWARPGCPRDRATGRSDGGVVRADGAIGRSPPASAATRDCWPSATPAFTEVEPGTVTGDRAGAGLTADGAGRRPWRLSPAPARAPRTDAATRCRPARDECRCRSAHPARRSGPSSASRQPGNGRQSSVTLNSSSSGPSGCRRSTGRIPGSDSSGTSAATDDSRCGNDARTCARCRIPSEHPPRHRVQVVPPLGPRPVHPRPVRPPVVALVPGFVGPVRIVDHGDLVAHPDHRDAAPAHDDRVRQEQPADHQVDVRGRRRRLEPGQAGRGAADPAVAGRPGWPGRPGRGPANPGRYPSSSRTGTDWCRSRSGRPPRRRPSRWPSRCRRGSGCR